MKEIKECSIQKMGNEQKCCLIVIFVSLVSRRFRLVPLLRFAYAMKESIKNKNFVVRALKTKQAGNVFLVAARKIRPW